MLGLMRRNRRPTVLRHLLGAIGRQGPNIVSSCSEVPSHHILCAGTYSPVFARLAAESALAACPEHLRAEFRLYIHVDGVDSRRRADLMAWLGEIPGIELSYGIFGIYSGDYIPGKWHQVMVNDVVKIFGNENYLAFIDADLFLYDESWWNLCQKHLADDLYALTVGMRPKSTLEMAGHRWMAMRTNLFTVNVAVHRLLNQQRFSKDKRAEKYLRNEFPQGRLSISAMDSQVTASLRAQAHGYRVVDVFDVVPHCHVGGYSHMKASKFNAFNTPERRPVIDGLLNQARFLPKVIDYFDRRGWGSFVDPDYRLKVAEMSDYITSIPELHAMMVAQDASQREIVFDNLVGKLADR